MITSPSRSHFSRHKNWNANINGNILRKQNQKVFHLPSSEQAANLAAPEQLECLLQQLGDPGSALGPVLASRPVGVRLVQVDQEVEPPGARHGSLRLEQPPEGGARTLQPHVGGVLRQLLPLLVPQVLPTGRDTHGEH